MKEKLEESEKSVKLLMENQNSTLKLQRTDQSALKSISSNLLRRVHITQWITKYNSNFFLADLIAGITIGLTMIPQSIAYAALAGLSPNYGLYSAFIGSYIYVIFGSVKQVSIGPTSLMALLVLPATYGKPIEYVFVLAFIAGLVELLFGVLRLGFIVDFIPLPVISAFTSATSLVIIGSQLKGVTGTTFVGKNFSTYIYGFVEHIGDVRLGDTVLGVGCIVTLLLLRKVQEIPVADSNRNKVVIKKILWYITISRNALVVLFCSILAFYLSEGDKTPFKLSGKVQSGVPRFSIPAFSVAGTNETTAVTFSDIIGDLGLSLITVPLVAILANVSIAKAFAAGTTVDATQEMIALGLCNIFGAFVQAMPTCGAFTRSAVSEASGVKSPLAGIYSGTMTVLALSFLTQYFYFIPRATLSAVLITAVFFMIDIKIVPKLWHQSRKDFYSWLGCFVACLVFGVELGLCFGVLFNFVILLYYWARPNLEATVRTVEDTSYIHVTLTLGLLYPGVDHLRNYLNRVGCQNLGAKKILLDCTGWSNLDYTTLKGLENIAVDFEIRMQKLVLINVPKHIERFLVHSSKLNYCVDLDELRSFVLETK